MISTIRQPRSGSEALQDRGPVELTIEGMHCASCVGRIERALDEVEGVEQSSVNLATGRATVSGPELDLDHLVAAVARAGYAVEQPQRSQVRLRVDGMHCASCVGTIESALKATPGVSEATVNLATGEARVSFSPEQTGLVQLVEAVAGAGYEARPIAETAEAGDELKGREARATAELQTLRRRFVRRCG